MPPPPHPSGLLARLQRDAGRATRRARNGIRLATGAARPTVGSTPKDTVWRHGRCELWRYRNDAVRFAPPLLIVHSLVSRSYILDLAPGNSFVERLRDTGFDVYLLDWGVPDARDAGNRIEDYVDEFLPGAIRRIRDLTGSQDVTVVGYCFGGILAMLHAARHRDAPVRSLSVLATPVDFRHLGPLADVLRVGRLDVDTTLDDNGNIAPQVIRRGFKALTPTSEISRYVDLWDRLWDDDYLVSYQHMTGWADDHIPFPGAAGRQGVDMLVRDNALLRDAVTLGGEPVRLADLRCPFLSVLAERDHIVPEPAVVPLIDLVGSPDRRELRLDAGHVGLLVGKTAAKKTVPRILDFLCEQSTQV